MVDRGKKYGPRNHILALFSIICSCCSMAFIAKASSLLISRYGVKWSVFTLSVMAALLSLVTAFLQNATLLLIVYGILLGASMSIYGAAPTIIIQSQFAKSRSLVQGAVIGVSSLLAVVWSPFTNWLIQYYGLTGTFLILAGINLQGCVCALLATNMCQQSNDQANRPLESASDIMREIRSTFAIRSFTLLLPSDFLFGLGAMAEFLYLPILGISLGVSESNSAFLLSINTISTGVGAIVAGAVGNLPRMKNNRMALVGLCVALSGAAKFAVPHATSYGHLAAVSAIVGFAIGSYVVLVCTVGVDIVGASKIVYSTGLLGTNIGLAISCSGALLGLLEDIHNVNVAFYVAGILQSVASVISMLNFCYWKSS